MIQTLPIKCDRQNPRCDNDAVWYVTDVVESELVSGVVCDDHLKQLKAAHPEIDFMPRLIETD
jgi:hypothetical protein